MKFYKIMLSTIFLLIGCTRTYYVPINVNAPKAMANSVPGTIVSNYQWVNIYVAAEVPKSIQTEGKAELDLIP